MRVGVGGVDLFFSLRVAQERGDVGGRLPPAEEEGEGGDGAGLLT